MHARDLDRGDPDRVPILAAIHRLHDNDPDLKQYRYFVVDLLKDQSTPFACVALADKDGAVEMTDDQAEIITFALEKRSPQWVATSLTGVGFAAGATPLQSDCAVNCRVVNTFAHADVLLPGGFVVGSAAIRSVDEGHVTAVAERQDACI